ncbi:protein kinase domain-containing protein [Nannocystis pusilla]|uniref:protein kinase domain-containing protein n=1 Tax=Nannocystis pusilla TaxID=889268 RepID=UPI003BEFBBB3
MSEARRLGRYVVGERLGSGGLGEVYLAHVDGAKGFRKRLVVKQVRRELARRADVAPLLLAEAEVVQRLAHGNIVQLLDVGVDDGAPYLVMEHVDGVSLAELACDLERRGAGLEIAAALFVVESVSAALAHAHAARDGDDRPLGLVHRDVTPANILVSRDGVVKLTDFGIAAVTAAARDVGPGPGTPGYAAPEQLAGGPVDARADVYALGVVLGQLLPAGDDLDGVRSIAARAAAAAPDERFPDVARFAAALEQWRAARRIPREPGELAARVRDLLQRRDHVARHVGAALDQRLRPPRTAALPAPRARRRPLSWPIDAAAMVVLAGLAWFATRAPDSPVPEDSPTPSASAVPGNTSTPASPVPGDTSQPTSPVPGDTSPPAAPIPGHTSRPPSPVPRDNSPSATPVPGDTSLSAAPVPGDASAPVPEDTSPLASSTPASSPLASPAPGATTSSPLAAPVPKDSAARPGPARPARGRLLVNLVPWAEVRVDGGPARRTPVDLDLAAGRHTLELSNPELGQRRTRAVTINRGAVTRVTDW